MEFKWLLALCATDPLPQKSIYRQLENGRQLAFGVGGEVFGGGVPWLAVLWRRNSQGTQSAAGSRFVERILTIVETCRQQQRHPLDYIRRALSAQRSGLPIPSILPAHAAACLTP